MGTTLTGTTPQDTYDSLIKVTDNGPLSGTLKALSDGLGNDSALALSTTAASIAGTLAVTGNATFDTNTLFVDSAANQVGVGTITPKGKIDVLHGLTNPVGLGDVDIDAFRLEGGGITAIRAAQYDAVNQPAAGDIQFLNLFFNGSSYNYYERARITAAGNVGIGTSAPAVRLHVYNGDAFLGLDWASANYDATPRQFRIASNGNNSGYITQAAYNSSVTAATTFFRSYVNAASSGALVFESGAGNFSINSGIPASYTERMRITSAGVLDLAQGQIQFPVTQVASADPNTLDDYEEGTWTPSLVASGGTGSATYLTQLGTYTKIGRQVVVQFFINFSKNTLSGGTLQMTGLPFTAQGSLYPESAILIDNLATALSNPLIQMGASTTNADLIENNGGTGSHAGLGINTYLGTNPMNLRGTITYFV